MNDTLLGSLVGAGAALGAQALATFAQAKRENMRMSRTDAGVRRQVKALVSEVGKFVYQCRTQSPVDWSKMRVVVERMQTRLYNSEVSTALTDEQAEALYAAAGTIEVAFQFTLQQPWGNDKGEKYDAFDAMELTKATYKDSCGKLARFWSEMGDSESSKKYKDAYEKPD